MPNNLLVQRLFDRLRAILGAQCSPQTIGTLTTCTTIGTSTIIVVTAVWNVILVTGLDRIGDKDDCTISHQDVSTTLVVTRGRVHSTTTVPTLHIIAVRRRDGREHTEHRPTIGPATATLVIGRRVVARVRSHAAAATTRARW